MPAEPNIVYILTNTCMPGFVKIGITRDLERRMKDLDGTGVPMPFECHYACIVENARLVESSFLQAFDDKRVRPNREFLEISPEQIAVLLRLVAITDVTPKTDILADPKDKEPLNELRARRSAFNFEMVKIPPGSILTFSQDPGVTCQVRDGKNVEFRGKTVSLSVAAQEAMGVSRPLQGPLYWLFDGENLVQRRIRMEYAEARS